MCPLRRRKYCQGISRHVAFVKALGESVDESPEGLSGALQLKDRGMEKEPKLCGPRIILFLLRSSILTSVPEKPRDKSFHARAMGPSSLALEISNRKSQISDLGFEICHLQSRRACPRSPRLAP